MRKLIIAIVIMLITVIILLGLAVRFTAKAIGSIEVKKSILQQRSDDLNSWKKQ
jgi:hypothetical protein